MNSNIPKHKIESKISQEEIEQIKKKVRLSEDSELFVSTDLFHIFTKQVQLFNNQTTKFEYLVRKPTVSVIAITQDNKLIVLHQQQPGVSSFIDFPSGSLDSYYEDELDAIQRELLEETGMISDDIFKLKKVRVNDIILWDHTIFIARNCKKIKDLNLDAGEKIRVELREIDEIFEIINLPDFRDLNLQAEVNSYLICDKKKKEFLELLKYQNLKLEK